MHDEPPLWLKTVVAQHTPRYSAKWKDLICDGCTEELICMVSWTPEHLSRMIHKRLCEAIESLYVT